MKPLHVTTEGGAAWLGFLSTVACIVGGVGVGYVADQRTKRGLGVKRLCVGLTAVATGGWAWFAFLASAHHHDGGAAAAAAGAPLDKALEGQLFAACTLASLFGMATAGIFYEAAVEAAYPVDPVLVSAMLTVPFNTASATYEFSGAYIEPKSAMNWIIAGMFALLTLLLTLWEERRLRAEATATAAAAPAASGAGGNAANGGEVGGGRYAALRRKGSGGSDRRLLGDSPRDPLISPDADGWTTGNESSRRSLGVGSANGSEVFYDSIETS